VDPWEAGCDERGVDDDSVDQIISNHFILLDERKREGQLTNLEWLLGPFPLEWKSMSVSSREWLLQTRLTRWIRVLFHDNVHDQLPDGCDRNAANPVSTYLQRAGGMNLQKARCKKAHGSNSPVLIRVELPEDGKECEGEYSVGEGIEGDDNVV
jgi:hypothetical protein